MFKKIEAALDLIISILCYASTALILFLMFIIIADIFVRTFFSFSIVGTPAFARNSLIGITFLALPRVTKAQKHVRSELVLDKAKGLFNKILNLASSVIGIAVFSVLTSSLYKPTLQAIRLKETDKEGMTFIPLSPFYIICLVGAALSAIGIIFLCARTVARKEEKGNDTQEFTGFEI